MQFRRFGASLTHSMSKTSQPAEPPNVRQNEREANDKRQEQHPDR
jgi:hypothetical protein